MICTDCKKTFGIDLSYEFARISCGCNYFKVKKSLFCDICKTRETIKLTDKYFSFKCNCRMTYIFPEKNIKTYVNEGKK